MGFSGAALALAAIGTAMSAYGSYQSGQAQKAQANFQSDMANRNAKIAEMNAQDRERQGQIDEKQLRLKTANTIGQARSDLSGSGVVTDTGSPLDIIQDTAAWGAYDVATNRQNVAKDAWAIRNQAQDYQAQSGLYSAQGANAAAAGNWGAATSLVAGAGSVADKWYTYNKSSLASQNTTNYDSLARR